MTSEDEGQLQGTLKRLQREVSTLKRVAGAVLCTDLALLAVWAVRVYWARFSIH